MMNALCNQERQYVLTSWLKLRLTFLPFSVGAGRDSVPAGLLSLAVCSSTGCSGSSMTGAQPLVKTCTIAVSNCYHTGMCDIRYQLPTPGGRDSSLLPGLT